MRRQSAAGSRKAKAIVAMAAIGIAAVPLVALDTTLDWRVGRDTVIFKESVRPQGSGLSAEISTNIGEYDSLSMDGKRSTLEWRRKYEREGTDLVAVRNGPQVRVRGTFKGKPYDRTHDFGELPWYQFQEISYEELFKTGAESASFWTIDRSSLKSSLFTARKKAEVEIEVMGRRVAASEYHLTVSGVPAFLFTSHFWLRRSDGRFLRLDVPPILGLPRSRVELTSESER
jgi:hypothetical protein